MRLLTFASFLIILFVSCGEAGNQASATADTVLAKHETIDTSTIIKNLSQEVLTSIKNKDYGGFSKFIHPTLGVRFSPYGYIDTTGDLIFLPAEFLKQVDKEGKLLWGYQDGSGDPIDLNIKNYFTRFVYDVDFLNAPQKSFNKLIGQGNSNNNLEQVYKNSFFTESHFSGFNKKYNGMDWKSLRLVFKSYNNQFYLVGVIHDEWTI